jgi:hypothetical protein
MTERPLPPNSARGPMLLVTGIFLLLALALIGLMAGYRTRVLEPRLENEAPRQRRDPGPFAGQLPRERPEVGHG